MSSDLFEDGWIQILALVAIVSGVFTAHLLLTRRGVDTLAPAVAAREPARAN